MTLINDMAERKLLKRLSSLQDEKHRWRIALFSVSDLSQPARESLLETDILNNILDLSQEWDVTVYLCHDGDMIFLAPASWSHFAPALSKLLADHLQMISLPPSFTSHDLKDVYSEVLALIRCKLVAQHVPDDLPRDTELDMNWYRQSFAKACAQRFQRQDILVAVAEDDRTMREYAKSILAPHYAVITAQDGMGALELYSYYAPDVLFLDITMPGMDGLKVLERICEMDRDAKIIMVTAHNTSEVVANCLKLGAKGYVIKPFRAEKLLNYAKQMAS